MTTHVEAGADSREKSAGEQLGALFSVLAAGSTRLLTPVAGVIVAVIAVLVMAGLYAHSWNGLRAANADVEEARSMLTAPGPDLPDPSEQLLAWESVLTNAKDARTTESVDSEFVQTILGAALDTGVNLVTASAQRGTTVELDGREYGSSPYLIRVSGDMSGIRAFLRKLESGLFETLEVSSSVVTRDGDSFLASVGTVIRNEIITDLTAPDLAPPPGSEAPVSVDSRAGAAR